MADTNKSGPFVPRRYLGLELAGAKNQKTTLAAIEYYPKEQKIFLLDIYDRIVSAENQSSDEALIELIQETSGDSPSGKHHSVSKMGVNVPLTLPPCLACTRRACITAEECTLPAVKWMRDVTRKFTRNPPEGIKVREFTPYTQRPIELWVRYNVLPDLSPEAQFEIDEALGGNKAPLTARMNYLKRYLEEMNLVEVWPKLTIARLATSLGVSKRNISSYRHLEEGVHARLEILEALAAGHGIFIYERDLKKLSHNLTCFDAFICAYTALLSDRNQTVKSPTGFPLASGWVEYPVKK